LKKMTWDDWKAHEEAKRKEYEEMGVTDLNAVRAEKMWNDPTVKDEDLPAARFEYDPELKEMVFVGYSNEVKH
tara:strand:- start:45 stop:263 length:219 start_codon:yes stop_codon:yes gene_type:complete